jgi:hypothetical protein
MVIKCGSLIVGLPGSVGEVESASYQEHAARPLPSPGDLEPLLHLFKKSTAIQMTAAGAQFFGLRLTEEGRQFFKGAE